MNKQFLYLLISIVMLSSCKRNTSLFSVDRDGLGIVEPRFDYLSAKAKFKFDHDDKKVSATANFRIKRDSIIWISITPGLGLEVARVLISNSDIYLLDKLDKKYHEYTFKELSEKYGFDFNFNLIQSVILGNLSEPYRNETVVKSGNYLSYISKQGTFSFNNFIGKNSMKLERVRVTDDSTKNTISVNYGDFSMVDQQIFPNKISAVIDYESEIKPNTEIDISYNKLVIEQIPLSFPFSVPSRYGRK